MVHKDVVDHKTRGLYIVSDVVAGTLCEEFDFSGVCDKPAGTFPAMSDTYASQERLLKYNP
jgi:hypothetical protein